MSFRQAVANTPDISTCYQSGLKALGAYSAKVLATNTSLLHGGVDIDSCTSGIYPDANRWDYAIAYNGEVYFIEVHSAKSDEVSKVIRKFHWLTDWLNNRAPEINRLKARIPSPYYWIQSRNFSIPKTSPQYRSAKKAGLIPISKLYLN